MHTKVRNGGIIILVKTPQYIIYFFYYPHSKIPSPKKTADRKAVFFFILFRGGLCLHVAASAWHGVGGAVPSCGGFGLAWCTVGGGWFLRVSIIWRLTFGKGQLLRFHFDSFYRCYESVAKGRPCPLPPGFAVRANPL